MVLATLARFEAFHDACLVLGERPLPQKPESESGKFFVGFYVMYSRLVFFAVVMILVLPLLHRLFHKLHLDDYLLANMLSTEKTKSEKKSQSGKRPHP